MVHNTDITIDLDELTHQTQRREFSDGLRDFHVGALILILSLMNWFIFSPAGLILILKASTIDKSLTVAGLLGLVGMMLLFMYGAERLMERVRRASLWKDSGYVKPLRWGINKWLAVLSVALVLIIIVGSSLLMLRGLFGQETALRSITASAGVGTAVIFFGMGHSLKIRRYKVVGILGGMGSIPILFCPPSFAETWLWFGIGWAILLFSSGSWALHGALSELRKGEVDE
jgi:small-conductance mechanosensitive channel